MKDATETTKAQTAILDKAARKVLRERKALRRRIARARTAGEKAELRRRYVEAILRWERLLVEVLG